MRIVSEHSEEFNAKRVISDGRGLADLRRGDMHSLSKSMPDMQGMRERGESMPDIRRPSDLAQLLGEPTNEVHDC